MYPPDITAAIYRTLLTIGPARAPWLLLKGIWRRLNGRKVDREHEETGRTESESEPERDP